MGYWYEPIIPVMTQPIVGVMPKRCVTLSGSMSLSYKRYRCEHMSWWPTRDRLTGTLRWVMITVVSFPLTAIEVTPAPVMALNAYSDGKGRVMSYGTA